MKTEIAMTAAAPKLKKYPPFAHDSVLLSMPQSHTLMVKVLVLLSEGVPWSPIITVK